MKKFNLIKINETLVITFVFIFFSRVISNYEKINDFYIQKKENYSELKKLNESIISDYQINLPLDSELYKLKEKVEYDESMINGFEPNTNFADYFLDYYWWILIGLILIAKYIKWLSNKDEEEKTTHNYNG